MAFKRTKRLVKHILTPSWCLKRYFSRSALKHVEAAVQASEATHGAEIRVVIESRLAPHLIWSNQSPRQRALDVFSLYRVWDTELNNGVLIYLLLADRAVEIVADRGVHRLVGTAGWQQICGEMQQAFKQGQFETGLVQGINRVGNILQHHYLLRSDDDNELPNKPVLL